MTATNGHGTEAKELGREQRELACKLDDDELRARGDSMAEAELEIEQLKEQRRGINGKIADLSTTRAKLAEVIDAREEKRMVACVWIEDLPQNKKNLVRQDTGEHIDVRALTGGELQAGLQFGAAAANDNGVAERPADDDGKEDAADDLDERDDSDEVPDADTDEAEAPPPPAQQARARAAATPAAAKKTSKGKLVAVKSGGKSKGKSSKHTRHSYA